MSRPANRELLLRIEPAAVTGERRGIDLVLAELRARRQRQHVEAAQDLRAVDPAVIVISRPEPAEYHVLRINRSAVEVSDLGRPRRVGEVGHRDAALVPGLDEDI